MTISVDLAEAPIAVESQFHRPVATEPGLEQSSDVRPTVWTEEIVYVEALFGILLASSWIALFVFGSTVEPAVYREQLRTPIPDAGLLGLASAMLGVTLSYTPSNVCWLSIVSAMLGCFGRRMRDRQRARDPANKDPALGGHHTVQYGFAVISGFVLYLTLMGGILIITSEHASSLFENDGSTSQYVRVATLCALFATFFGFYPERMQMLFDQIQSRMPFSTGQSPDSATAHSSRPSLDGRADHGGRGQPRGSMQPTNSRVKVCNIFRTQMGDSFLLKRC
jgi:hypothetical protein